MYRVSLTQSLFPAVRDGTVEKLTIGDLLRRRAKEHAGTIALKELGYDGAIGRTWTYVELLGDRVEGPGGAVDGEGDRGGMAGEPDDLGGMAQSLGRGRVTGAVH